MKIITEQSNNSEYAFQAEETKAFCEELLNLFQKFGLAIVPTYDNYVNFHDTMRIIPLDEKTEQFIKKTGVCFNK